VRIAVIGGGINGLCISWEAAKRGADVSLFEKNEIMRSTSSASTKLLHGGLRYLENFEFKFVRESLRERNWWLENVPNFTHPLEIQIPVSKNSTRSLLKYKVGLMIYDVLAGKRRIQNHSWIGKNNFLSENPALKNDGIIGGFVFYDGQMDDYKLGCWVADQAKSLGVKIIENSDVSKIDVQGRIAYSYNNDIKKTENRKSQVSEEKFDFIVNATGSWAEDLLNKNGIIQKYKLDHIRGSHLLFERKTEKGYLLEIPGEKRFFFVLPFENKTLIGTTEIRQSLTDDISCSIEEKTYLINAYNHYFSEPLKCNDVIEEFAGIRPIIKSKANPSKASREYLLLLNNKLLTVYGGKWTTARSLASKACNKIGVIY